MRPIGISSGALALSDFRRGLEIMRHCRDLTAIELSALRYEELDPLLAALDTLDLSQFSYVSIHAPSRIPDNQEEQAVGKLAGLIARRLPVVIHPDAIRHAGAWAVFGKLLCIENMDKRKPTGRSAKELAVFFEQLPAASLCLDLGHARQFDPSMTETYLILRDFGHRLGQLHISEVNTRSTHDALSYGSIRVFQEVAHMIPEHIPVIIESPLKAEEIDREIARVREALPVSREETIATS